MFDFLRRRARRPAFDDGDWATVLGRLPLLGGLESPERELLRERAAEFLSAKILSPSAGWRLRPDQALEIAIWASLPVLHRGIGAYAGFHGVIVYPTEFLAPREEVDEAGVVHTGLEQVSGESWEAGPVLLSWEDVEYAREPGCGNVVIHELAHKLDMGDGSMNGVPDLAGTGIGYGEWAAVMREAWEAMQREEDQHGSTAIDDYALESPAEFFAVFSEEFFTAPRELERAAPAAWALLARYYGVDTRRWCRGQEV